MIFGNQAPKFQVSSVDILLDFAVIETDETDKKSIVHESQLNRARSIITKSEHHEFVVLIHLHRYADPEAKFDEITAHLNSKVVKLWRHRDGVAFRKDTTSNDADFWFESYEQLYITTSDYADALRLVFRSIDIIDHSVRDDNWTFARALSGGSSFAYYVDPTTELWVAAADTTTSRRRIAGRFRDTGILIEGGIQNLANTALDLWTESSGNITISLNSTETKDPEGNNNAYDVAFTSVGEFIEFNIGTGIASNDGNFSVFVKCRDNATSPNINLEIRGVGGGLKALININTVSNGPDGNGFTRYDVSYENGVDPALTGNVLIRVHVLSGANQTFFVFWPQFELGVDALHPSAPIPGNQITRNAESFEIASSDTNMIRDRGTIHLSMKSEWDFNKHRSAMLFSCADDGTTGTRHSQIEVTVGGNLRFVLRQNNDGTIFIDLQSSLSGFLTRGVDHTVDVTWDATISNGVKLYFDGVQLGSTSVNGAFNISELGTQIALGHLVAGGVEAFCELDELFIDDKVWSADEILQKFNSGSLPRTLI